MFKHSSLLRFMYIIPGNDHRLGANEAPPSIISIFLGADILSSLLKFCGQDVDLPRKGKYQFGDICLPGVERDSTDRNRTSPFAYTGMKFEFRAVGSSQAPHRSNVILNTIMADAAKILATEIEKKTAAGMSPEDATKQVIVETVEKHSRILFDGNGYSAEWRVEAEKRGLPNLVTSVDAYDIMTSKEV